MRFTMVSIYVVGLLLALWLSSITWEVIMRGESWRPSGWHLAMTGWPLSLGLMALIVSQWVRDEISPQIVKAACLVLTFLVAMSSHNLWRGEVFGWMHLVIAMWCVIGGIRQIEEHRGN